MTAAPDADPVALAGAAVRGLLDTAPLDPAGVPLLVVGCADPADWPRSTESALLDGEFAADVVRRVLVGNGLVAAVPLGVSLDPARVEDLAGEAAAALVTAEGLDCALVVTTSVRDGRLIATAAALHPASPDEPVDREGASVPS
ncbi:hypothetical protein SZN_10553 [Streptomyces zinciresistens K42]|uniref:Uncharacterized protein n=1 Tax=Streptomyces zinciresistens K42 TaxID=700597 RepID=G2G9D0_9ACTN|nr:hypothetical protein [Streptomyces zinciresistens]EGX59845.1 hypothetical protein SZN_10553 [Streptomyces zinciresistens K42]